MQCAGGGPSRKSLRASLLRTRNSRTYLSLTRNKISLLSLFNRYASADFEDEHSVYSALDFNVFFDKHRLHLQINGGNKAHGKNGNPNLQVLKLLHHPISHLLDLVHDVYEDERLHISSTDVYRRSRTTRSAAPG